jgi:hypothetical protein
VLYPALKSAGKDPNDALAYEIRQGGHVPLSTIALINCERMITLTDRVYRWAVPVLGLWLATWILLSWAGVQDDAFIHLRYADNLFRTHLITYDGVHPNYGASSLLYVYLLAFLRAFTASPNLPRVVSSCAHLLLAAGLLILFFRSTPRDSSLARLLGFTLIFILVSPSAIRWLDDGMETGLALCFVAVLCWVTFRQSTHSAVTPSQYLALVAFGLFAVLLRTELILLCGLAFAILTWTRLFVSNHAERSNRRFRALLDGSHLLLGGLLALAFIRLKMHAFLPDTALAKSDGVADWYGALYVTGKVFAGALSFGAGMFLLWLLSVFLTLRAGRLSTTTLFPNLAFPVLFALAASRGQQIQGARYFVWTLFFSILWNIFELSRVPTGHRLQTQNNTLAFCFLALLVLALPFESRMLYPMLRDRAGLLKQFEGNHFESLQGKRGVAFDIGYLGYFSHADICDLAGLVNGRDKARQTTQERLAGCFASHPDFIFVNMGAIGNAANYLSIKDWKICSRYDFKTVNQNDPHYLIVPRSVAPEVCRNVANTIPSDIPPLLH